MTEPSSSSAKAKTTVRATDGLFVIGLIFLVLGVIGVARVPFMILGGLFMIIGGGARVRQPGKGKA